MTTKRKPRRTYPDAKSGRTKTIGYGYVGTWLDGTLGWFLPEFLGGYRGQTEPPPRAVRKLASAKGDAFVLCRITIEAVPGVRRKIVRRDSSEGRP